jgi:hypothetical protein
MLKKDHALYIISGDRMQTAPPLPVQKNVGDILQYDGQ